jgi:SAM-dependent methyltransferase
VACVYRTLIPPGMRILELGCGQADLSAALQLSRGVGMDPSERGLERGRARLAHLIFCHADVHDLLLGDKFDFIIHSDLVIDIWDVQRMLELVAQHSLRLTRVVLNSCSRLREFPRKLAGMLHLAKPQLSENWLTKEDLQNLLYLAGFETIRGFSEIIWPLRTPGLDIL